MIKDKRVILFIFIFLVSAFSHAVYTSKDYASDINYDDQINYEILENKIKNLSVNTLVGVLNLVPKSFYNGHVLVYRSRSLQDSSYENPRAVVFGKSAKFVMAFNGDSRHRGFNNLEIVQYRESSKSWEFREITFWGDKPPVFSEPNPKKCLECHQSPKRSNVDPRPNWEPYNFWPGVYGSVDDEIKPVLKEGYEKHINNDRSLPSVITRFFPQDMFLIEEQSKEETKIKEFEKSKFSHSRYKFLPEYNTLNPLNMTKSLVGLNMRRVARLAKEGLGQKYEFYKYALYGLGDYGSFNSSENLKHACGKLYLPEDILDLHIKRTLEIKELKGRDYKPSGYRWRHGFAAGIDIIFEPLGVLTDDWSMDFKTKGRFSATDRFTSPNFAPEHFLEALYNNYPEDSVKDLNCDQLKEASFESLTHLEERSEISKIIEEKRTEVVPVQAPLINRCIRCHVNIDVGGDYAPYIPFDNFAELKLRLQEKKYKRGTLLQEIIYRTGDHVTQREQMPPAGFVDTQMRDSFINLIENL